MRIRRKFAYEGGESLQDMTMEQRYEWTERERTTVPLCVRNAIEAAAVLGSRFFGQDIDYGFALDAKERPTLIAGASAHPPPGTLPIDAPLRSFWNDLLASDKSSFDAMKVAPDIDKTDVKRPFLAQMMLLDLLLRENPYHETRASGDGVVWSNSWHLRRDWSRKRFLDEVAELRAPT
jgi:hypothetical protein